MKSIAQQLKGVKGQLKSVLPSTPAVWNEEGGDHINISYQSASIIGRCMTRTYKQKINHPVLGQFATLLNVWEFIRAAEPQERYRTALPKVMFDSIMRNGGYLKPDLVNAKAVVWHAAYILALQDPVLYRAFAENDLPFDCYQKRSLIPTRNKNATWTVKAVTEIGDAIREDREPNLFFLFDLDYIERNGLKKKDYRTVQVYDGIVDHFLGGKWPDGFDIQAVMDSLQQSARDKYHNALAAEEAKAKPKTEVKEAVPVDADASHEATHDDVVVDPEDPSDGESDAGVFERVLEEDIEETESVESTTDSVDEGELLRRIEALMGHESDIPEGTGVEVAVELDADLLETANASLARADEAARNEHEENR